MIGSGVARGGMASVIPLSGMEALGDRVCLWSGDGEMSSGDKAMKYWKQCCLAIGLEGKVQSFLLFSIYPRLHLTTCNMWMNFYSHSMNKCKCIKHGILI